MNVIDHRQFTRRAKQRRRFSNQTVLRWLCIVGGVFIVLNIGMAIAYAGKVLPGYRLGSLKVGGADYATVDRMLNEQNESALKLTLEKDAHRQTVMAKDLGITIDKQASLKRLKDARPFLPFFGWFGSRQVSLVVKTDQAIYNAKADELATVFIKQPLPRRVVFANGQFQTAAAEDGYKLDKATLQTAVQRAVGKQRTDLAVPVVSVKNEGGIEDLSAEQDRLQSQLATKLVFQINGTKVTPSKEDIGSWYSMAGQTMAPDLAKIRAYVSTAAAKQGSTATNNNDLGIAVSYLLGKRLGQTLLVTGQGARLHTYCTATRGASAAQLPELIGKLAATYADPRGWSAGGAVAFEHVADGDCQYTVWLASPGQMTSFGAICDNYYNCQVGSNVVVNNDRWLYATDAWNKTGQDLETYRLLIINHETGHRLGFRDNPTCPGTGLPAPVMMQQSISLEGCTFNVWPLASELDTLKSML